MTTITTTTYCNDPQCPGHRTSREYPGQRVVLTDNPALPLALVSDDEEGS